MNMGFTIKCWIQRHIRRYLKYVRYLLFLLLTFVKANVMDLRYRSQVSKYYTWCVQIVYIDDVEGVMLIFQKTHPAKLLNHNYILHNFLILQCDVI